MIHLTNKLLIDECNKLIDWFNSQNKMEVNSSHESVMFTINDVHDEYIKNLILTKVYEVNNGYNLSWMTFAKISTGGSLIKHKDMVPDGVDLAKEIVTAVFYLNDNFDGGEITFDLYDQIKPIVGSVLVFDGCNISHAVNTVNNGDRYTLSTWSI